MATQIHWFPGHMKKAVNEISEKIKLVDVVIEILDARIPLASMNEQLEELIKNKKRVVVISKADLADPEQTKKWANELKNKFDRLLILDLNNPQSGKEISKSVSILGQAKHEKEKAKGMKPQPIKTMIIGIPNVGKSSLINRLANRKAAGVQNKPGFTRGEQWIKVNNDFILLDTPGVLPTNYESKEKAAKLALIGSIREEILPNTDLVNILISFLKEHYPLSLFERFKIESITNSEDTISAICKQRGLLDNHGAYDIRRGESLLLKEFKDGKLGRISLEWIK